MSYGGVGDLFDMSGVPLEGQPISGPIAAIQGLTGGTPASPSQVSIEWADGQTTSATSLQPYPAFGSNAFEIIGQHTYADDGEYAIVLRITENGTGTTDVITLPKNLTYVGDAPLNSNNGTPITATAGTAFSGTLGSFNDADPNGKKGDYKVSINWGDGSAPDNTTGSVTANANGSGNSFNVAGTHTYTMNGPFTITTTVTDKDGESTSFQTDANVTYTGVGFVIPQPVNTTEGTDFKGTVATFTALDPNAKADAFTALISWGDGGVSQGDIKSDPNGGFDITGEHTYAEDGTKAIAITVTESAYGIPYVSGTVATVADAALTATNNTLNATEGKAYSGVVASFTDANKSAAASDFTAVITWGDGHVSAGTVAANGSRFDVSGANTYAEEGSDPVTVQITDKGGSNATANSTMTVADAALTANGSATITGKPGVAINNATLTTFTDAGGAEDASHYTATITWGDGQTSTGAITTTSTGFQVSGSHTYSGALAYNISVTIKDEGGSSATATTLADLRPPTPPSPPAPPSPPSSPPPAASPPSNSSSPATSAVDQIFAEFEQIVAELEAEIQQMVNAEMAILSNLLRSAPKVP